MTRSARITRLEAFAFLFIMLVVVGCRCGASAPAPTVRQPPTSEPTITEAAPSTVHAFDLGGSVHVERVGEVDQILWGEIRAEKRGANIVLARTPIESQPTLRPALPRSIRCGGKQYFASLGAGPLLVAETFLADPTTVLPVTTLVGRDTAALFLIDFQRTTTRLVRVDCETGTVAELPPPDPRAVAVHAVFGADAGVVQLSDDRVVATSDGGQTYRPVASRRDRQTQLLCGTTNQVFVARGSAAAMPEGAGSPDPTGIRTLGGCEIANARSELIGGMFRDGMASVSRTPAERHPLIAPILEALGAPTDVVDQLLGRLPEPRMERVETGIPENATCEAFSETSVLVCDEYTDQGSRTRIYKRTPTGRELLAEGGRSELTNDVVMIRGDCSQPVRGKLCAIRVDGTRKIAIDYTARDFPDSATIRGESLIFHVSNGSFRATATTPSAPLEQTFPQDEDWAIAWPNVEAPSLWRAVFSPAGNRLFVWERDEAEPRFVRTQSPATSTFSNFGEAQLDYTPGSPSGWSLVRGDVVHPIVWHTRPPASFPRGIACEGERCVINFEDSRRVLLVPGNGSIGNYDIASVPSRIPSPDGPGIAPRLTDCGEHACLGDDGLSRFCFDGAPARTATLGLLASPARSVALPAYRGGCDMLASRATDALVHCDSEYLYLIGGRTPHRLFGARRVSAAAPTPSGYLVVVEVDGVARQTYRVTARGTFQPTAGTGSWADDSHWGAVGDQAATLRFAGSTEDYANLLLTVYDDAGNAQRTLLAADSISLPACSGAAPSAEQRFTTSDMEVSFADPGHICVLFTKGARAVDGVFHRVDDAGADHVCSVVR